MSCDHNLNWHWSYADTVHLETDEHWYSLGLVRRGQVGSSPGEESVKEADCEAQVKRIRRIDAVCKFLKLQEDILQQIGLGLLRAWDLIELCLKRGTAELVLSAFDVFAWSSSSFWISNKPLLEKCWKNAIDQNDWKKLYDVSIAEGWRDEDTLLVLEKSVGFPGLKEVLRTQSESYEGGFDEVLPLRQDGIEQLQSVDTGSASVEAILMQHEDFPGVGKAYGGGTHVGQCLS